MKWERTRTDINDMMEKDGREVETHFVDNPFIRVRERASQKALAGQNMVGEKQLLVDEAEAKMQDIVMMQENNMYVIKDME